MYTHTAETCVSSSETNEEDSDKNDNGVGANLVMVLFVCHASGTYRHLGDKRSREDALEEQPGAGLEE